MAEPSRILLEHHLKKLKLPTFLREHSRPTLLANLGCSFVWRFPNLAIAIWSDPRPFKLQPLADRRTEAPIRKTGFLTLDSKTYLSF